MKVALWHVHGSWTTSLVSGGDEYLLVTRPGGGPWGRGRAGRNWPATREVNLTELAAAAPDVVVLQRPEEIGLIEQALGRRVGADVPAVYVEHNAPRPYAAESTHPLAGRTDIPLVHVTAFNRMMWDNGRCPTVVIDHGIVDPGPRYRGDLARAGTLINEPVRRARVTGTDLLPDIAGAAPVDVWGIGTDELRIHPQVHGCGDLPQDALFDALVRRRVFVHTARWTSLGLSLLEAMHLGMPIVAVAATEAATAIPAEAGVVSTDPAVLTTAVREFVSDPVRAELAGKAAREAALARFGLHRFRTAWHNLLTEVTR